MCTGLISGRVLTALHCWDTINQLECVTELPCRVMLDVSAGAGKGLFVSLCLLGLFMEWCVRLTCCRVVTKTDLKNAWGFSVPWPGTESYFTASFFQWCSSQIYLSHWCCAYLDEGLLRACVTLVGSESGCGRVDVVTTCISFEMGLS